MRYRHLNLWRIRRFLLFSAEYCESSGEVIKYLIEKMDEKKNSQHIWKCRHCWWRSVITSSKKGYKQQICIVGLYNSINLHKFIVIIFCDILLYYVVLFIFHTFLYIYTCINTLKIKVIWTYREKFIPINVKKYVMPFFVLKVRVDFQLKLNNWKNYHVLREICW